MPHTPEIAAQYGRLGGLARAARDSDPTASSAPARAAARSALDARLAVEHGIDLDGPTAARQIDYARRLHYARLALKSAEARRRNRAARA